eukprot:TRINITY_DN10133_c0_g1_i1.p1 TRINITY_DN10133_c0_g1~~TRINITY_DN10133_c0_g1_i1.p1  ORF type:complete len:421 (-),score=80.51 TRINITY_DN10133_c0_g1_i1:42-1304(-)
MATNHSIQKVDDLKVTIHDVEYNLTTWQDYHPGGQLILQQYNNADATDAFVAFHGEEATQQLKKMKGTPVTKKKQLHPEVVAYRELREKLLQDGWFETDWAWETYKIASTYLLFIVAGLLAYLGYWFPSAIILGIAYQQAGWLGHDFCHHNVFKNRKFNNFFGYITGNLLNGFSVNWWKDRHNTHHAITNVLDSDPDIDNLPLFSWSVEDLVRAEQYPLAAAILPYQHIYFPLFTPTLKLIWALQSVLWLKDDTTQNKSYIKSRNYEQLTLVAHWLIIGYMLFFWVGYEHALFHLLISQGIGGAGIACVVFMNHYAMDAYSEYDEENNNFVKLQLSTTRNIQKGVITDWICGGLNYQIEHHLFPLVPRHNLSKLQPIVQQFCEENELPYDNLPFTSCFKEIEKRLYSVAKTYEKISKKQD